VHCSSGSGATTKGAGGSGAGHTGSTSSAGTGASTGSAGGTTTSTATMGSTSTTGSSSGTGGGGGGLPTATPVCGTSMLNGPTTPPAGAVMVSPGAQTIQNAIAAHPNGGTTYYLAAGTYLINGSINPNDNDTFIGAPGAIIDGGGKQPVAFGYNAHPTGVTLKYLTIQHFAGPQNNGIVNQNQGTHWTMQYCTIQDNPDTMGGANGFEVGDDDVLSYNCFSGNGQGGIGVDGAKGFVVDHNEIKNNAVGYEAKHNCGCSAGMKTFTSTNGTVTNNWIHDNGNVGLWVDTNNSFFLVQGNVIENNWGEGLMYEISYNAVIQNNVFRHNDLGGQTQASDFPSPAIYISESGGYDAGAAVMLSGVDVNGKLAITNNAFYDNADGVVLYQNATRCCGTTAGCGNCGGTVPLYPEMDSQGNQRWNTQNVSVTNNVFSYGPDAGCVVTASPPTFCGVQGLFSTSMAIDQLIAFKQNNVFDHNDYTGPWQFISPDQNSKLLSPAMWQAAPNNQDTHSTFH
jgi:hypothetical protein